MASTTWRCQTSGEQQGPMTTAELRALAASGRLKPTDLLWREGLKEWVPACKVKGLFPITPPAPARSPAPVQAAPPVTSRPTNPSNPSSKMFLFGCIAIPLALIAIPLALLVIWLGGTLLYKPPRTPQPPSSVTDSDATGIAVRGNGRDADEFWSNYSGIWAIRQDWGDTSVEFWQTLRLEASKDGAAITQWKVMGAGHMVDLNPASLHIHGASMTVLGKNEAEINMGRNEDGEVGRITLTFSGMNIRGAWDCEIRGTWDVEGKKRQVIGTCLSSQIAKECSGSIDLDPTGQFEDLRSTNMQKPDLLLPLRIRNTMPSAQREILNNWWQLQTARTQPVDPDSPVAANLAKQQAEASHQQWVQKWERQVRDGEIKNWIGQIHYEVSGDDVTMRFGAVWESRSGYVDASGHRFQFLVGDHFSVQCNIGHQSPEIMAILARMREGSWTVFSARFEERAPNDHITPDCFFPNALTSFKLTDLKAID